MASKNDSPVSTTDSEVHIFAQIVTYNSDKTIEKCLHSVIESTQKGFHINIIIADNSSSDKSRTIIEKFKNKYTNRVHIILLNSNLGFSPAHNVAINYALKNNADYIVLINPDMVLDPDCILEMYRAFGSSTQNNQLRIGAVTPKLYRTDPSFNLLQRDVLDAAGMYFVPSFRHFDRGSGEPEANSKGEVKFSAPQFVSGGTGACLMFSRDFIEDVSFPPEIRYRSSEDIAMEGVEFLDEAFIMYREDAELSLRAKLLGWRYRYEPRAVGFHVRRVLHDNRSSQNELINSLGVQNRFLLQLQTLGFLNFLLLCPMVLIRNCIVILACLIFERSSLSGLKGAFLKSSQALSKNSWIRSRMACSDLSFLSLFYSGQDALNACRYRDKNSFNKESYPFKLHVSIVSYYQSESIIRNISAVIDELKRCEDDIKISWHLSITNNSPNDPYFEKVRALVVNNNHISLIEPGLNLGFAGANNHALLADNDADCYLVLNPDIAPLENAFKFCINAIKSIENPGLVSPIPVNSDDKKPQRKYSGKKLPSLGSVFMNTFFIEAIWPDNPVSRFYHYEDDYIIANSLASTNSKGPDYLEVEHVSGACLFIPSQVFRDIKGFDDSFFPAWYEDVDLSMRIKSHGLPSILVPKATVLHEGGSSTQHLGRNRLLTLYYLNERKYWYKQLDIGECSRLIFSLIIILSSLGYFFRLFFFAIRNLPTRHSFVDDLSVFIDLKNSSRGKREKLLRDYVS
ncbi:MAG TPA: glycosyltransferase [Oligoflexia bacterium]|nr:glycosyltransferase [Oligoflexia bacterium]HMP47703.1 glycosyltransferase [Oligoflexia bacterium]